MSLANEIMFNFLVKLTRVISVVRGTDRPDITIAVDLDVKHQTNTTGLAVLYNVFYGDLRFKSFQYCFTT